MAHVVTEVADPDVWASAHLSDALRDLALRVHEDIYRTDHTVTEDKFTGDVVETLTVRWKRGAGGSAA
jgi:hypothetical protein